MKKDAINQRPARIELARNQVDATVIRIDGFIGDEVDGAVSKRFAEALAAIPSPSRVVVEINSQGGLIRDGLGIFNAIAQRKDEITARVTGCAFSIASVIPLAASRVIAPRASIWMIHEPWMMAAGNAEDMLKAAEALDIHARTIAEIYAAKTGKSPDEMRGLMRAETWLRGADAFALGLVDEIEEFDPALNAFDPEYLAQFKNCPAEILAEILARPNNVRGVSAAARNEAKTKTEEPMQSTENTTTNTAAATVTADNTNNTNLRAELEEIKARLELLRAPAPVAPGLSGGNPIVDALKKAAPGRERRAVFERFGYDTCRAAMESTLPAGQRWGDVFNANTFSATLVPDIVADSILLAIGPTLAPLQAFTRGFTTDAVRPRANIDVPNPTAFGSVLTNATSFESGDATVGYKQVAVNQKTKAFHVANTDIQQGFVIQQLAEGNAIALATALWDVVATLLTTTNFTNTPVVSTAALFGQDAMQSLYASVDSNTIYAVLANAYYAKLLRWQTTDIGPDADGFARVMKASRWSAAGANVVGFACDPSAILLASGLPKTLPEIAGSLVSQDTVTIPGVGLTVQVNSWVSTATRALWLSYDVMFGAAVGNASALTLLKSA